MASDRIAITPAKKPCARCGSTTVAWKRGKKWYMVEVFTDLSGYHVASKVDFHSLYCGNPDEHQRMQAEILRYEQEQLDERNGKIAQRHAEKVKRISELTELAMSDPDAGQRELDARQKALDHLLKNFTSMDYFTEHCRDVAEADRLREEISILDAAIDDALTIN